MKWLVIDPTIIRAHQHAAGARKNVENDVAFTLWLAVTKDLNEIAYKQRIICLKIHF